MPDPRDLDVAEIEFNIGDVTYRLEPPTAAICLAVSRACGGLEEAVRKLRVLDTDALMAVFAIAYKAAPTGPALLDFIYENQRFLFLPLTLYVLALERGGKPVPEASVMGEGEGDAANPPAPRPLN